MGPRRCLHLVPSVEDVKLHQLGDLQMKKQPGYGIFLVLTILATLAALFTLVPSSAASKTCLLGYKAACAFAPASTAVCLLVSLVVCRLRGRLFIRK
jgi:hypothetical protein